MVRCTPPELYRTGLRGGILYLQFLNLYIAILINLGGQLHLGRRMHAELLVSHIELLRVHEKVTDREVRVRFTSQIDTLISSFITIV